MKKHLSLPIRLTEKILESRNKRHLLYTLLIIHLGFFLLKAISGDVFLYDSHEYYNLANNIKYHFEFYSSDLNLPIRFESYTKRPPLYGLFVLVFSFFLKTNITVLLVQNILSIISIYLCLNIFEYYYKKISYLVLTFFIVGSLSQFIYANYLMSEILFQFLIVLFCYLFHKTIITKKTSCFVFFQIVIVLLFLTKPVFYLFLFPNLLLGFFLTKYIKNSYLFAIIPISICVLYMGWNYQRTGSFEFSSIQNINLKNYNLYYFNVNKYGDEYAQEINDEISFKSQQKGTYAEKQKEIKSLSLNFLQQDLFSYLIVHAKGCVRMFIDPGRFDLYNFFEFEKTDEVGFLKHLNENGIKGALVYFKSQPLIILLLVPIVLAINLIKLFGFIRFWVLNIKNCPKTIWFMLLIILYISGLTGLVGTSRFLVAILPLYLLMASIGLSSKKIKVVP
jgi:hypothetical protein